MAQETEAESMIQNTVDVRFARGNLYALVSVYKESDPVNAGGQLYWAEAVPGGETYTVFSTNDPVSCLWASPAEQLWIASADGNIFTTAPVSGSKLDDPEITFGNDDSGYAWKAMSLPRRRATRLSPNVAALWGTSDADIFAACFEGCVYHWNGAQWTEMDTGVTSPLITIHGTGPKDVYCTGMSSVILHYDGNTWTRVPVPRDLGEVTVITGLRSLAPGKAYAVSLRGHILEGNRAGFQVTRVAQQSWSGIAWFQGRLILSANPGGAWELVKGELRELKANFAATGVIEAGDLLLFIETDQPNGPSMIQYDPRREPKPWARAGL